MKKIFTVLILFICFNSNGQFNKILFHCDVVNDNKEPISGAYISLENIESGEIFSGISNRYGWFELYLPKHNNYFYKVEGFNEVENKKDTLFIKDAPQFKFTLTLKKSLDYRLGIKFTSNSSEIANSSYPIIDTFYLWVKDKRNLYIEIGGHTDNIGSSSDNLKLSKERAEAVRLYLIDKGVDSDLIISKGYGESIPILDNETEKGRSSNRRTEIKFLAVEF